MIKRSRTYKKQSKIKQLILRHIEHNIREYTIACIIFLIGIVIGVIFINNLDETVKIEINDYINTVINNLKTNQNINTLLLLKNSISTNLLIVFLVWLMGSTVMGLLIVYFILCFRGFCLGYTVASIIATLGTGKGLLFVLSTMLIQNIIFIPCIISLVVSSMNLYNSIMKDRRKENIKLEILRHTVFSVFILILLILSSIIEVYVSEKLLIFFINYM